MKKFVLLSAVLITLLLLGAFRMVNSINNLSNSSTTYQAHNIYTDFSKLADNLLKYPYLQPPLGYTYDALEPNIDKMTMEIHYSKHYKTYTDKFNDAVKGTDLEQVPLIEIFRHVSKYAPAIRNFGGGFYNHMLYFKLMIPNSTGKPEGKVADAINKKFGSFEQFKNSFSDAAKNLFGSGWAWLSLDEKGELFISTTANQDNPLMDIAEKQGIPVLCIDVWEHAYYLKYQNKRADYVSNFWNVINWNEVEKRYEEAMNAVGK